MTSEQLNQEIHKGREVLYACFSRIFLDAPTDETYTMIKEILPYLSAIKDSVENDFINQGYEGLEQLINKLDGLSEQEAKDFKLEILQGYTTLFCMSNSIPISGSVYLTAEKLVNSETTGAVVDTYNRVGFEMKHESNEPADHIAYQLMFMADTSMKIARSIELGNNDVAEQIIEIQKTFLEEQMISWIPEFVKLVVKYPISVYLYAPAAYFMLGYLKADQEFITNS